MVKKRKIVLPILILKLIKPTDRDSKENADLDTPSYEHGESEGDELESITDAASQKAQRDLVDDNAKEWIYLDRFKVNIKEIKLVYREVLNVQRTSIMVRE